MLGRGLHWLDKLSFWFKFKFGNDFMTTEQMSTAYRSAMARGRAASGGAAVVILTISLYYEGLVDGQGVATELYAYTGGEAEGYAEYEGHEVGYRDCLIETEAAVNGGKLARFIDLPFELKIPDENDKGGRRAPLRISNISREISRNARAASDAGLKVYVTFRGYLLGAEKTRVDHKALRFEVKKIDLSGGDAHIELIGDMPNLVHMKFPRKKYNLDDHPFLAGKAEKLGG